MSNKQAKDGLKQVRAELKIITQYKDKTDEKDVKSLQEVMKILFYSYIVNIRQFYKDK